MVWGKAGSTTLSSTSDTITVSGMTASKTNQILNHAIPNNDSTQTRYSVNGVDSGSKYSYRNTKLGQYHSTAVDQNNVLYDMGGEDSDKFSITYACDVAGEEKLFIGFGISRKNAGAGEAPARNEIVWKYETTSARVTSVKDDTSAQTGTYAVDSNLSVLGSDITPAAAIGFAPNVQVGSRAEITDSRKMYSFSDSGATDIQDKTLVQNGDDITYSGGVIDVNIGSSSSSEGDYLLHTLDVPITTTDFVLDFDYKRVSGGTGVFGGLVFRSNQSGESIENSNTGDYIRTSPNAAGTSMNMYWHNDGDSTETQLGYLTGLNSAGNWNYLRLTRTNGTNIKLERFSSAARSGSADAESAVTNLSATWGLSLKYIGGYCAFANGGGLEEHFDNIDLSSTTKLWQEIGS